MIRTVLRFALAIAITVPAAAQKPSPPKKSASGSTTGAYRNASFNFQYDIPFGWVDRTKDMQEGNDAAKGEVLLAIFERPPQAAGDSVNSAVVIAAEKTSAYPGVKTADDYLAPLTALTTARGFQAEGDPSEAVVAGRHIARVDFSRKLNDQLTMYQSTLVLFARGQIVTFTFVAESQESANQLIEGLNFSPAAAKSK